MRHKFTDTLTLDNSVRKRAGGYLVADARVARTGIQVYNGSEVGRPDMDTVRVYRAPEEVFDKQAMASFANIPVTNDHPTVAVTADNWSQYAKGQTDGDIARDGERLRVPLMVSDGATIAQVEAGKKELSAGYTCDLEWLEGVTADGQTYDASQKNIRANHVAIVAAGRAGSEIRIGDGANDGGKERTSWGVAPLIHVDTTKETPMSNLQTVVLGDKAVSVSPADVATIDAFKADSAKALTDAKAAHDLVVADLQKDAAKKDAELADLKTKVLSDADLDKRVATRAALVADAKAIAPKVVSDGVSDADIRKAVVVDARGADAVADKPDAYIDAAYDILVDAAKAAKPDAFRDASLNNERKTAPTDVQSVRDSAYADHLATLNGTKKEDA